MEELAWSPLWANGGDWAFDWEGEAGWPAAEIMPSAISCLGKIAMQHEEIMVACLPSFDHAV